MFSLSVPCRDNTKWHWITPGLIVATLGLIGFSLLFSWYAANFGSYNVTYGSLGTAIVFMTWMWLSSTIILIGAEIDAEIETQNAKARANLFSAKRG
jgi:membrane protein